MPYETSPLLPGPGRPGSDRCLGNLETIYRSGLRICPWYGCRSPTTTVASNFLVGPALRSALSVRHSDLRNSLVKNRQLANRNSPLIINKCLDGNRQRDAKTRRSLGGKRWISGIFGVFLPIPDSSASGMHFLPKNKTPFPRCSADSVVSQQLAALPQNARWLAERHRNVKNDRKPPVGIA